MQHRAPDWNALEEKAKKMAIVELMGAIKDCGDAAKAMRGWNPEAEGYYMDEASVYNRELRSRQAIA